MGMTFLITFQNFFALSSFSFSSFKMNSFFAPLILEFVTLRRNLAIFQTSLSPVFLAFFIEIVPVLNLLY